MISFFPDRKARFDEPLPKDTHVMVFIRRAEVAAHSDEGLDAGPDFAAGVSSQDAAETDVAVEEGHELEIEFLYYLIIIILSFYYDGRFVANLGNFRKVRSSVTETADHL